LGIACSLLGTGCTLGGCIVKHLATREGTDVRKECHGGDGQQDKEKENEFPHLLTSENPICAIGTHKPPRLVELHILLEWHVVGAARLASHTVLGLVLLRCGVELGGGVLPSAPTVTSTDELVATATVLAANNRIANPGHVRTVAVARRLGFSAKGAEVASPPVTLGTDILLAGTAVGLEVDEEGGRAVRAGHFGRH